MFMVISTSEYFLTMILIEPPLLDIFVLLVKMLSGVYLVISFLFCVVLIYTYFGVCNSNNSAGTISSACLAVRPPFFECKGQARHTRS